MIVVGRHCVIFDSTGKTCTVNAFSPSAGKVNDVPIVDAVVAYDYPIKGKTYLLLMRMLSMFLKLNKILFPPSSKGKEVFLLMNVQSLSPLIQHWTTILFTVGMRILGSTWN